MIRQLPVIPTIFVVAAAGVMVWLGFWQLGRAEEKAAMIERYSAAVENNVLVPFPLDGSGEDVWFRRSSVYCLSRESNNPVAGTSERGEKAWAMRVVCKVPGPDLDEVVVDLGFSRSSETPAWDNGEVTGIIAPGPRLVAEPPLAGLEPLAKPDPNDLPNNHLAYAGQWFFFALTALIVYWFAVQSRLKTRD